MTRTKYDWKDKGDFTPGHDEIAIWLYENWTSPVAEIIWKMVGKLEAPIYPDKLTPEPVLLGNPRLYPDAIAIMNVVCRGELFYKIPVIFEIKPTIDSMGAVMRQIHDYQQRAIEDRFFDQFEIHRHHRRPPMMMLVTNTRDFDAIFEDQGIHMVHPEDFPEDEYEDDEESQSSPSGQDTKTKEAL